MNSRKGSGKSRECKKRTNELRVYGEQGRKQAAPEIETPQEVGALGSHALVTKEVTAADVDGPGDVGGQALTNAGDGLLHRAF